jgi:L-lactate utilization protein LutC
MKYDSLANSQSTAKTIESLKSKNYDVTLAKTSADALAKIKSLIPSGASVMNGSSKTLDQIGFVDYLKLGTHGWNNLHAAIVAEKDPVKQGLLRQQSALSDFYLGSVHALVENGEFIIASNTGSQLPHVVFTSKNLIFVVSTKKIVPTLDEAMNRLNQYILPLENARITKLYGSPTSLNKIVIFKNENPMLGRKVHIVLVEEDLGF